MAQPILGVVSGKPKSCPAITGRLHAPFQAGPGAAFLDNREPQKDMSLGVGIFMSGYSPKFRESKAPFTPDVVAQWSRVLVRSAAAWRLR